MKKFLSIIILFSTISFSSLAADLGPVKKSATEIRIERINKRIKEIQKIDLNELDRPERKALKKEVKSLKKEIEDLDLSKPIGLSVGAAIIILLLLIIIL